MVESLLGQTNCYGECQIEHNCFGGYLNEEKMCDKEISRVLKRLMEIPGVTQALLAPKNNKSLFFLFKKDGEFARLKMDNGIVEKVK